MGALMFKVFLFVRSVKGQVVFCDSYFANPFSSGKQGTARFRDTA
jgi:hypothetical protein